MLKEFMLYIRNAADAKAALSEQEHFSFIKKCEEYINQLKAEDKLVAAQPLVREGFVVLKKGDDWNCTAIDASKEVQVGYYHVRANDIDEAVAMAKDNPEFEYVSSASIEVRPIKTKEEKTGFVYPK